MSGFPALRIFLTALVCSVLLNIALFGFLPFMTYLRGQGEEGGGKKDKQSNLVVLPVMQKKKEPPKNLEPPSPVEKKAAEPGKSLARQRFIMDLGPGGGSGGAAGAPVSSGDLKQVSYEEGEVDEEAKPIGALTAPKKPKKAEAAGVSGLLRVLVVIREDGKVEVDQFLEVPGGGGNYGFEEAVREVVATWRFQPAKVGGVAVRMKWEQPFKF